MAMPSAKGLFHRAVEMSGAMLRVATRDRAKQSADTFLKGVNLKGSDIKKLQAMPWYDLLTAQADIEAAARAKFGEKGRVHFNVGGSQAVEDSLKRLQTDYIDLYQQHFPDPDTPIDEHLEALDRLVKDGKVREIGSSNFSGAMIDEAAGVSERGGLARFVSTQNRYSLLDGPRHDRVIDA